MYFRGGGGLSGGKDTVQHVVWLKGKLQNEGGGANAPSPPTTVFVYC